MGYTSKEVIDYQNLSKEFFMYATNLIGGKGFSKGVYRIEVYCESRKIRASKLTLK